MRYTVTKAFRPRGSGSPEAAAGTELELTDAQAQVFKALNWVKPSEGKSVEHVVQPAPAEVEPPRRGYFRKVIVPAADPVAEAVKPKRTYQRRDLTAEKSED